MKPVFQLHSRVKLRKANLLGCGIWYSVLVIVSNALDNLDTIFIMLIQEEEEEEKEKERRKKKEENEHEAEAKTFLEV